MIRRHTDQVRHNLVDKILNRRVINHGLGNWTVANQSTDLNRMDQPLRQDQLDNFQGSVPYLQKRKE